MKIKLLFLFFFACSLAFADENSENAKKLKATTLCVVIEDETVPAYKKLKDAVEKFWDFTKYKFIKKEEIATYINDPNYSVMAFIALSLDPASTQSHSYYSVASIGLSKEVKRFAGWGIYILLGDKKNKYQEEKKAHMHYSIDDLHPVVGSLFPEEKAEPGSFDYLVAHALKEALNQVKSMEKNMKLQEYGVYGTVEKEKNAVYYNDGKSQINKTLYVEKELAGKKGAEKKYADALGISAGNVKIVSHDEIADAIEKGDESINYTMNYNLRGPLIYAAKDSKPIARIK
ncbi:MAG: hypothetical protein HY063_05965 [Bacteroidetes bacterium]|nr:hypothetical protein [Bacteroidota bacterium]